MKVFVNLCFPA